MPPTPARTAVTSYDLEDAIASAASAGFTEDELRRLFALLAVPSVSAGAGAGAGADLRRAAELCAAEVKRTGGKVEIRETERNPLVVGSVEASTPGKRARNVLIYGHYDVQPADPLEAWVTPPFEPTIRAEYLYCRGANDDKGQLFALLVGVQRLRAEGRLPVDVSFLIDGEEEIGGTSAAASVGSLELPDVAIVFDAPSLAPGIPALYVASRGIVLVRVDIETGTADAHSGHFGGAALNAAHVLTTMLGALLPRDGRLPPPLMEGVAPATEAERAAWAQLPEGAEMLSEAGLAPADAAAASEFYERTTAAPALDVHSIHSGSPQAKTVVTTRASAILSIRLAPGQSAQSIGDALETLIMDAGTEGASIEVTRLVSADPALTDPADPMVTRAADAIAAATELDPQPARLGGSVPILAELSRRGVPAILTGFHDADDGTHSPNERISLDALNAALTSAGAILTALG